ncbi:transglutaminase domain-containing protein [Methanobrevibacter curvatus]|uniref:Putative outer membrane protein pmp20 n=1 Tax=Methanobrevibacter curvatus TaxID=49547 RepID=A0A166DSF7_9EURY|nr:transglutaminase domain-containing protein [Methanobrevibacter curvatus]KZX15905.1 putative outer membrane protein pmp20 precursor [Methanobrevibacter curvatus]
MRAGIFLLILVFLFSLSFSATSAGNLAVSGDSFDDINNIINTASSGDIVQLGSNTFKSNGSVIRITKENLTFTGASANNPATLSGENISRIAWVNANNITFRYIKFINGNGNTLGGTAITTYTKITVDNCTFLNNAGESGAAIFIYPQAYNSVIKNSIFNNNLGSQPGTDNFVQGGAIRSATTNLTITDSTFTNNFALNDGGAISITNGTGTKIINCKFINNSANIGGAIRISDSEATISNSIFNQNNASNAGAIFIFNGTATILNSNFTSNKANNGGAIELYNRTNNDNKTIILKNLIFDSNTATNMGGAIHTQIPIKYLNDSIFNNNSAINGGGIYSLNNLQINAVNFSQNTATTSGGAIYTNGQISISSKSNFISNNANNGGSIYALKDLNISNSIFSKNNAISNGGALYINGGTTRILSNSNFSSNNGVNGGAIYPNGVLSISANFNDNLATGNGGAIYSLKNLQISSSNFNGNNASNNGGALYLNGGVTTITGKSTFNENRAINGGGVYTNSNLTINSLEFSSNIASSNGAGLYINSGIVNILNNSNFTNNKAINGSGVYSNDKLVVNSVLFLNNNASANGGAIYSLNDLNIIATNFNKNTATNSGGAIYTNGISSISSKSSFYENKATNGGAIYSLKDLNISTSIFSKNNATSNGGAVYINGGTTRILSNSNFSLNRALNGGVIYSNNLLNIVSANFNDNLATVNGGAIFSLKNLQISSSKFNGNSASNNGGALYLNGGATTITSKSTFSNNKATNGGAIYNNAPLIIQSSTFKSNKATSNGGAIYSNKNLNITGGSIVSNSAHYGSGIYNLATLRISKINISSNIAKIIGIYLKYPSAAKPSTKIKINTYLKTGDNILEAIYNTKGNTYINGTIMSPLNFTPNKTFASSINNLKKSIKSNSKGTATREYSVGKNIKTITIEVSYSQNNQKWSIKKSIKVSKTAKPTSTVGGSTKSTKIKSTSSATASSNKNGGNVRVSFSNHENSHLASLINMNSYKINSKKISYWNLKVNKTLTAVTDYVYKVDNKGWYYSTKNNSGVGWKKLDAKPTISGTWFNLTHSNGTYGIGKLVPKYTNNTSNKTIMFFVSVKTTINHKSLTPYISYTYKLTNKNTKANKTVRFFEKSDNSIYLKIDESSKVLKSYNDYLVHSTKAPTNNKNIISLTKSIVSKIEGSLNSTTKAKALFNWVRDKIAYPPKSRQYYMSSKYATGTLSSREANCVDQSSLLISMLRTANIPSQYIHYHDCTFRSGKIAGHVWVGIFIGKWIEVDTTSKSNSFTSIVNVKKKGPKHGSHTIIDI